MAIALHLGHRQSVDYDFFGNRLFDPASLAQRLPFLRDATITQQSPNTLSATVDRGGPVLVSFFGLPDIARVRPPHMAQDNGLRIASLLDLAGAKAAVVQQRAEAKDYRDLDAILADGRVTLPAALASARDIFVRLPLGRRSEVQPANYPEGAFIFRRWQPASAAAIHPGSSCPRAR
jgi:hypothetical protein